MILKTERLILRNFKDDDFNFFYKYRNDAECAKYQGWSNTSKEYLKTFLTCRGLVKSSSDYSEVYHSVQ